MSFGVRRRCAAGAAAATAAVFLLLALAVAPSSGRADMAAGWRAFTAGEYEAAVRAWQPLAEAGDHQAAVRAWQPLAEAGDHQAAVRAWQPLAEAGDHQAAVRAWQPLAEAGDHQAAYALGQAFQLMGEAGRAVPWYEQAARRGVSEAQILLGTIYARGAGVPRDLVRAYAWLHRAAAKKSPNVALILDSVAALMSAEEIAAAKALSAAP